MCILFVRIIMVSYNIFTLLCAVRSRFIRVQVPEAVYEHTVYERVRRAIYFYIRTDDLCVRSISICIYNAHTYFYFNCSEIIAQTRTITNDLFFIYNISFFCKYFSLKVYFIFYIRKKKVFTRQINDFL